MKIIELSRDKIHRAVGETFPHLKSEPIKSQYKIVMKFFSPPKPVVVFTVCGRIDIYILNIEVMPTILKYFPGEIAFFPFNRARWFNYFKFTPENCLLRIRRICKARKDNDEVFVQCIAVQSKADRRNYKKFLDIAKEKIS